MTRNGIARNRIASHHTGIGIGQHTEGDLAIVWYSVKNGLWLRRKERMPVFSKQLLAFATIIKKKCLTANLY